MLLDGCCSWVWTRRSTRAFIMLSMLAGRMQFVRWALTPKRSHSHARDSQAVRMDLKHFAPHLDDVIRRVELGRRLFRRCRWSIWWILYVQCLIKKTPPPFCVHGRIASAVTPSGHRFHKYLVIGCRYCLGIIPSHYVTVR